MAPRSPELAPNINPEVGEASVISFLSAQLDQISDIERRGNKISHRLSAGDMCLDLAYRVPMDPSEKSKLLHRAEANWELALGVSDSVQSFNVNVLRVKVRLSQIPYYWHLIMDRDLPERDETITEYNRLTDVAKEYVDGYKSYGGRFPNAEIFSNLRRDITELSVLMPLKRHGLMHEPENWAAGLSVASQRVSGKPNKYTSPNWAISIFSQDNMAEPPVLERKIQTRPMHLKNGFGKVNDKDIAVVYVLDDLALEGDKKGWIPTILQEIVDEQKGDFSKTPALNARTEKLLEILAKK